MSAPPPSAQERVRFVMMLAVVAAVVIAVFALVRVQQQTNSQRKYEQCLAQAEQQQGENPQFSPEDVCQEPD